MPVIDLACATCNLAAEVGQALQRYGFFYVANHGIPAELLSEQLEQNRRIFDLPAKTKEAMVFNVDLDIGYTGGGGTSQSLDPNVGIEAADTKEGFMLTNNFFMGAAPLDPTHPRKFLARDPRLDPNNPLAGAKLHWPPGLPGYEKVIRSYFASAYSLNYRLNDLLFASLDIDPNERARLGSAPFCVLKQLRYGPGKDALTNGSAIGAGAHADWGALTLLLTDGTPGLQVELDGEWLPVPPKLGAKGEPLIIVNAGDQIDAFTNGHYRSAKHRVITTSLKPRYSTAFFTYFTYREKLAPLERHVRPDKPLRWPPMDTHEWFQYKLRQSVGENVSSPVPAASIIQVASAASAGGGAEEAEEACAAGGAANGAAGDATRRIEGAPLGVEAHGVDILTASDADVDALIASMHRNGRGLLVIRNQTLSPEGYERALFRLGRANGGFGTPLQYDRWPGQSPRLRCCKYVSLLGNYRARRDDELGTGALKGERIGEYKPAREELREWHTDGSFLPRPKIGIALYAPSSEPVDTCAPCDAQSGAAAGASWWQRLLSRLFCRRRCMPAPLSMLPPEGGETAFASGLIGYELLDAKERAWLETLGAVHSWCDFMRFLESRDPSREKASEEDCAAKPDVTWPLVRTHPVTGRRALYLNPKNGLRIVRLADGKPAAPELSAELVLNLTRRVIESGSYRHAWRPGDLVLWDNRVLVHAAVRFDADKYERLIYRAEFSGEPVYFF